MQRAAEDAYHKHKNEIVKSVRRRRDRSARRESGQHLIEGERLVFDALEAGIVPETLFIEQGRTDFEARVSALGAEFFSVSQAPCLKRCATLPLRRGLRRR